MNRSTTAILALALAAILFLSVNIFSTNIFRSARLDLTESGLYTLSAGSKRILAEVPEPVRLRFYFSEKLANQLPNVKSYGLRVRELLEEYANLSNGKVRLEIIDPEPFTDAEDEAVRLGMQAVPIGTGESLYFGLVATNTIDDRQVVPFFSREKEAFLEYDLTRMLYNLSDPKKPVVGLITGLQMNTTVSPMMRLNGGAQAWGIVDAIRGVFDLRALDMNQGIIPKDVDILMIAHPLGLGEQALYAIDQFVMAGGRALVFMDPFSEVTARDQQGGQRNQQRAIELASSDLEKLLNAWGVSVPTDHVLADYETSQQVNAGQGGAQRVVRYLVWLQLGGANLNPDDVVTADLGPIMTANTGTVLTLPDTDVKVTPLIFTGVQAMRMETNMVRFGPAPDRLLEMFKPDGEQHVLAARLSGKVKSAFPDGPPKGRKNTGHLNESAKDISVIVVADSDMLHDQFWLRQRNMMGQKMVVPIAANGDFVINALDNLSGSSDLIGLRSRGKSNRPFVLVQSMRLAAEQKFQAEERKLKKSLEKSTARIAELESRAQGAGGGGNLLTPEQAAEIKLARTQVLKTRKQLRDVQHNLNREIDGLEARLKFANVGLMPLAVAVVAAMLAVMGIRRRRRAAAARR
ncbi:MAG: Gldg family protein [Alphaproteobacteria bacterium]|nr:Gldg family protein [Alphaproteobacteria bacterium]